MRRLLFALVLTIFACSAGYTQTVNQRMGKIEKKVGQNTKRISALEKGTKTLKKAYLKEEKNPIAVYLIRSESKIIKNSMGLILTLVVENAAPKPVYAFSGIFVFRTSDGRKFFSYPYVQSDPLFGYKRRRVLLPIDTIKYTKTYLRFMRDKNIKVTLENQVIYK